MINVINRYLPVLDLIEREHPRRILDVGCGNAGLGLFYFQPYTGCDVDFSPKPVPHMQPVPGSVTALPFPDGEFDFVLSLDTLEHLPPAERRTAIAELVRVSRKWVVVGCPCGPKAWAADRWLYRYYERRGQVPIWMQEHMQAPFSTRTEIEAALLGHGVTYKVLDNESIPVHLAVMLLEHVLLDGLIMRSAHLKQSTVRLHHGNPWLLKVAARFCLALRLGNPYRQIFLAQKEPQLLGEDG